MGTKAQRSILAILSDGTPRDRAEIAGAVGLCSSYVSLELAKLLKAGKIKEAGKRQMERYTQSLFTIPSAEELIIKRLTEFTEAMESGEDISKAFRCREVRNQPR